MIDAVHGTRVTVNGGAASYTLSAAAGGNTVNAGSGAATLNLGGVYTKINMGSGKTQINDQGTYNVIKLAAAASGIAVISGKIFQNGTRLDLRTLLDSTSWNGDSAVLSRYLKIWTDETAAYLLVTPTGDGGKTYVTAKLTSYDSLSLSTLLGNAVLR